jgi:hypothetical protein
MFKSLCWNVAAIALALSVVLPSLAHAADFTEDLRIPMAAAGPRGLEAFSCAR